MIKVVETEIGEVELRNAMIDLDGTNLEEGVEIKLGGEYMHFIGQVDLNDEEEVEQVLMYFNLI